MSGHVLVDQTSGAPLVLRGVDASGTEDACVANRGFSYAPSDLAEATSIAGWHADAVRVPLNEDCWLGINGVPAQYSGSAYRSFIRGWVAALNQAGIVAILDLHWSAPGTAIAYQQWPMPDADHSPTFWSQVAAAFKGTPSVMFDLFNEPALGGVHPTSSDWACWDKGGCTATFTPWLSTTPVSYRVAGMQQLVKVVRNAGAHQPILLGGLVAAGDPCGMFDAGGNGGLCMWFADEPHDPAGQLAVSFHTYNTNPCDTPLCWNADVAGVAKAAPVVTGELGEFDCSAAYVDQYMQWADPLGLGYVAWSWQPAGSADTCSQSNLKLLADWSGAPNTAAWVGPAYQAHLASVG